MSAIIESKPPVSLTPPTPAAESAGPSWLKDALWSVVSVPVRIISILLAIPPLIYTALMPLSALLLMTPVFIPEESVIEESVGRSSFLKGLIRRLANLAIGMAAMVAIFVSATELVVRLGVPRGWVAWAAGILFVYALDILFLIAIGRVPLAYNFRNLMVRWKLTFLTALAFTLVVGLLTVLLAFVNGMYTLTNESGQPGNVLILSDGSTDEVFSNLGYSDVALIEREQATLDDSGDPLPRAVRVKRKLVNGQDTPVASRETYCIVNRPLENDPERRQFVQVRGIIDPTLSAEVHDLKLMPGSRWFADSGVHTPEGKSPGEADEIECVIGAGLGRELGKLRGQDTLVLGDTFTMGDRKWYIAGILNSDGTTFGSECWAKQAIVSKMFNKLGYTTLVCRIEDDGTREEIAERSRSFAAHLKKRFSNPKVNAFTELEYFAKLSEGNKVFLWFALAVAGVMAIGGIFGVMNTMFAAVASRIKDIGVMRILGFKRWQILVSFLFESLLIAILGGSIGLLLGQLVDGKSVTSVISSGQGGGGKTVILKLMVDPQVLMAGAIFTLVMGRLGGLIPALSATRMKLLDTLR